MLIPKRITVHIEGMVDYAFRHYGRKKLLSEHHESYSCSIAATEAMALFWNIMQLSLRINDGVNEHSLFKIAQYVFHLVFYYAQVLESIL